MTQQAADSGGAPQSNIQTPLCERLGIALPIISAGMGPISGPRLAAAVSNAGGLGVMGCTTMAPEEVRTYIKRCRELTDKPFGVDLILPARLDQSGARVSDVASHIPGEHRALAERIAREHRIEHAASNAKGPTDDRMALGTDSEAQIEVILEEKVPVFVGALGSPGWLVDRAHEAGTMVMSMVGNVKQAIRVAQDGADVVVAQGTEGGGHVGTMALLPQVLDAVSPTPVVAAGGIGDGRGLAASLVMGCQAVWVGTRFLATEEAGIAGWMKAAIVEAGDQSPVISRSYTGKRFRMLPNDWTKAWEEAPIDPLPMPLQPVLVMQILGAMAGGGSNRALTQNGAGNIAGLIEKVVPAAEVVRSMADEARALLGGWSWPSPTS